MGWASVRTLACFAVAAGLLAVFTVVELHTEKPSSTCGCFTIPRFTPGAVSIAVAFFCPLRFIFLITQYFPIREGLLDSLCWCATRSPSNRGSIFTPIGAVMALKGGGSARRGGRAAVDGSGSAHGRLHLDAPSAAFFGPIIISMVCSPSAVSDHRSSDRGGDGCPGGRQIGAGAAVNNTTRELGGTLGVAALGSVFASAYAPKSPRLRPVSHSSSGQAGGPRVSGGSPRRRQPRTERRAAAIASSNFHWVRSRFEDRLHRRCRRGHVWER